MRPNFPPWLVEHVPELADIENNFTWHMLRRFDRRNRRARVLSVFILPFSVTGLILLRPFAAELVILILIVMHSLLARSLVGRSMTRFLDCRRQENSDLPPLPLVAREIALACWARESASGGSWVRRAGSASILISAILIVATGSYHPILILPGLGLITSICVYLRVPYIHHNFLLRGLYRGALRKIESVNPEWHGRLGFKRDANWNNDHLVYSIGPPACLFAVALVTQFGAGLVGSGILLPCMLMVLIGFSVLGRFHGRSRVRERIESDLADLSEAVEVAIASMQGIRVLRQCSLNGRRYERADLSFSDCRGANLEDSRLAGANLRWADLSGSVLDRADLSGADLTGADLRGANLAGTNLDGACLLEARLEGACLWHPENLTRRQIDAAITDGTTRLPQGF